MGKSLKEKIIKLRTEGKTYSQIKKELGCSQGNISYHSRNNGLITEPKIITEKIIEQIRKLYKIYTAFEVAKMLGICTTTVKKYAEKKRKILTPEQKQKNNYIHVKNYRQKIKQKGVEYLGGKCQKCNYNSCVWAMDFHHLDKSKKEFNIARYSNLAWDKVKSELDKCILICSNCHRELHYLEHHNIDEYNKFIKDFKLMGGEI